MPAEGLFREFGFQLKSISRKTWERILKIYGESYQSVLISFPVRSHLKRVPVLYCRKYDNKAMEMLSSKWKGLVKAYNHFMHPNDNPTEHDRVAFDLLTKGQVDLFIQYAETHPVNFHVRDYNSVNFLIKAQDVANDTHPCKKLLTAEERIARAIKATLYLLDKGIDINYRDKTGGTALYAAVHWCNLELAEVLLSKGADPNLGSTEHFINLPLISATIKKNYRLITLLISYGADIDQAFSLAKDPKRGFNLSQKEKKILLSASNLQSIIRRRRYEIALGKSTVLSMLSEAQFQEMCFYM